jgi:tRNA (cytidine/uridine-2'-O-)-methyltransferase
MFEVVLYRPEIPPNTGNVVRLCANSGARLHLVEPLGFSIDDKQLRRAGLDYHEFTQMRVHADWDACMETFGDARRFAFTRHAAHRYDAVRYREGDVLVFGAETSGLPEEVLARFEDNARLKLPMRPGNRSLNLSNAVAVVVYEAWRQLGFAGSDE